MEFSRQEYWSGLPRPPPGDLPDSGPESASPESQANSSPTESQGKPYTKEMRTLIWKDRRSLIYNSQDREET